MSEWIEFNSGVQPVPDGTHVTIKTADGTIETDHADEFAWEIHGYDSDIVAYKIVNATPMDGAERSDPVNHPLHYNAGGIECIDALESAVVNLAGIEAFCTANAIKYLWRWKPKNGVEDLKKAQWYIDWMIKKMGGGQ